jgi:choline-sulfatase
MILFFMDECRADALGSYGNPVCKTPNLDAFARQGTRFADCHVQHPVCGASRCSC